MDSRRLKLALLASTLLWVLPWMTAAAETPVTPAECPMRTLGVDIDRLRHAANVQSVATDAASASVTVLFTNGDALRVGVTGCVTPMLSARLWVGADGTASDAQWLERARWIAGLILPAQRAAQVSATLQDATVDTHVDGGFRLERAMPAGGGYSLAVVRTPRDGLGTSLSMVFRNL